MSTRTGLLLLSLLVSTGCGAGSAVVSSGPNIESKALRVAAERCDLGAFEAHASPDVARVIAETRRLKEDLGNNARALTKAFAERFGAPPELDDRGVLTFKGAGGEVESLPFAIKLPGPELVTCKLLARLADHLDPGSQGSSCAEGSSETRAVTLSENSAGACQLVLKPGVSFWVSMLELEYVRETAALMREVLLTGLLEQREEEIAGWASRMEESLNRRLGTLRENAYMHMSFVRQMEHLKSGAVEKAVPPDFIFRSQEIQYVIESLQHRLLEANYDDYPLGHLSPWYVQIRDNAGNVIAGASTVDLVRIMLFSAQFYEGQRMQSAAVREYAVAQRFASELGEEHAHLVAGAELGRLFNEVEMGPQTASHLTRLKALRLSLGGLAKVSDYDRARLSLALARVHLGLDSMDEARRESDRALKELQEEIALSDFRARPFLRTAASIEASTGAGNLDSRRAFFASLFDGGDYSDALEVGQEIAEGLIKQGKTEEAREIINDMFLCFRRLPEVADGDMDEQGGPYARQALGLSSLLSQLGEPKMALGWAKAAFEFTPGRSGSLRHGVRLQIAEQFVNLQISAGSSKAALATANTHLDRAGGSATKPAVNQKLEPMEVAPALCLVARALEANGERAGRKRARALRREAVDYLKAVPERVAEEAASLMARLCKPDSDL